MENPLDHLRPSVVKLCVEAGIQEEEINKSTTAALLDRLREIREEKKKRQQLLKINKRFKHRDAEAHAIRKKVPRKERS